MRSGISIEGNDRGVPLFFIALRKKCFAAATSRRSLSRKSTVRPCLSTARYRYVQRPFTLYTFRHSARILSPPERTDSSVFQILARTAAASAESSCVPGQFHARSHHLNQVA